MKSRLKILFLFLLVLAAGMFTGSKIFPSVGNNQPRLLINGQTIWVEVAQTPQELAHGLSGRGKMDENHGMLFIFDKPGRYSFWMKEMKFNLDFVFISSEKNEQGEFINGEIVVDTVENVPYPKNGGQPQVIVAKQDFDKVLEINSGDIKKLKIKVGDSLSLRGVPI